MNRTMCPGQDTRYWRPGDIFTVPCGSCGASIEFFKDDASRRCSACGTRVQNPRLTMGCAAWCQHAKECLGYDPAEKKAGSDDPGESIADAIVASIRREFVAAGGVLEQSLAAYEKAGALVKAGGANPRIVFPAVLLLLADGAVPDGAPEFPVSRKILADAGADRNSIEEILEIIRAYREGSSLDSAEFLAVAESYKNP